MDFGILFFNSEVSTRHNVTNASNTNVYQFLIDTTKFADENGFKAVWVPERHFHSFGGLFPNPSVLAAHLAAITKQIRLRSGSVVIPLHSPISVAEEWAMVDHLSGGRVDIAFAPGWNPRDYAISPHNYPHRKDLMFEGIHVVRALWQGGSVAHLDGHKQHNVVSIQPPPKQEYLNVWVTSVGNEQTFWEAGATGANILTALLFQSAQDLGRRIEVYKKSLKYHGFDPSTRTITCMLHTYVHGTDADAIKAVDVPLRTYLADSVDLWKGEWSDLNKASKDKLIDAAFWRYINFTSLIGGVDKCEKFVKTLQDYGVTEIACLLDFGVEPHLVKESLEYINQMKNRFARKADISQTIAVIDEKHIGTPVPSRDKIIPLDKHDASIVEREVNTASSIMKIGLHIPGELNLHPGQYINIYRTTNSNTEWLSASVVSYKDNVALVYIKMTMFPLSKYFEQTAAIGDKLQVTGGHGRLCFNGENTPSEDTKCVLLAGGTGISGLYNMSNYIAKKTTHKPTLMYSARLGKTAPILHDILDANEDIEYKLFITGKKKDEVPGKNVTRGRITKEVLRECLQNDAKSTQFYVSGPAGFVADMLIFLRELGVDQSQLHYEAIMDMKLQATLKDKNVLIVPKEHLAQLAQQAQQAQQTQTQQTQAQPPVPHSVEQKKVEPVLPQPTPVSVTVSQDSNGASDASHNEHEHAKDKKEEIKVKEGRSGSGGKSLFSIFGKKEKATKA